MFQHHAEVDGLLHSIAQPLQLRPGNPPQVRLPHNGTGQLQQSGAHPIAFANGVLLQVLPVRQCGQLAEYGRRGKSQLLHQRLQRPFCLIVCKAFQNLQCTKNAGNLFFRHGSAPFSSAGTGPPGAKRALRARCTAHAPNGNPAPNAVCGCLTTAREAPMMSITCGWEVVNRFTG